MSGAAAFEPKGIENSAYKVVVKEVKDIAIFFIDPDGRISSWNDGAERMKGFTEKDVLGQHYRMLFTEEDIKKKKPESELEETREKGRYDAEEWRQRKDGKLFKAHVTLTRQQDDNGKVLGFFKITRDVTARFQREKEAAEKTQEIERLSNLKDEFICIASHELKNPLTTVKAYLQLLKQSFASELEIKKQYKDYLNRSYKQVSKLEKLISELLNASRIGTGKLQLNIAAFEIDELVAEAVANMRQTTASHKFVLETDGTIKVHADRDRIEQVVVNYLTNAIRYSPKGSEIRVTVRSIGGTAKVSVQDQGIGISKEDQEKVFSRFFRTKEKGEKKGGLGLGLYIVKGIIAQHHGEVSIKSEPGQGSCFTFAIPFDQPAGSKPSALQSG